MTLIFRRNVSRRVSRRLTLTIVADTNVIISAFLWQKRLALLADLINEHRITLCFSPQTLEELYRVVRYSHIAGKARTEHIELDALLDSLISAAFIVYPTAPVSLIADDPSDNVFLECALEAQTDFIVSGDKHLLALKIFRGIPIVSPAQFLSRLKAEKKGKMKSP